MSSDKLEEVASVQIALDGSITEKCMLEDALSKHQDDLNKQQEIIHDKEMQLIGLHELLEKEKEKHASDVS